MKPSSATVLLALAAGLALCSTRQPLHSAGSAISTDTGVPAAGPYLGMQPPGSVPTLFAPGIVSTGQDELNGSFSPDGSEFYYSVGNPLRSYYALVGMRQVNGRWTAPEVLPFSGRFSDADPFVSPDGRRLYFVSRRPTDPTATAEKDWDIWYVERQGREWGEPRNVGLPVNTPRNEMYVSVTRQGSLYYHSNREPGRNDMDIYRARWVEDRYAEPENLGDRVNTRFNEWDPLVAPDESWVIFTSTQRPDDLGRGDLYVAFRAADGQWTAARHMGPQINSNAFDYCPVLSPDGRFLFFSSYRTADLTSAGSRRNLAQLVELFSKPGNGLGDIYWVDARIIETFRR